jgi:dethiobiotin synthetase
VAKNKLGTINHTILTIEKLKESNANILGIIINSQDDFGSQSEKINALNCKYIEDYTGVKILATLPFIGKVNTRTLLSISMPKSLVNKVSL